jgi:hypothetical protein
MGPLGVSTSILQTESQTLRPFLWLRVCNATLHPIETSSLASISIPKRNCHCCLQRIGEQMWARGEGDSLIASRIAVFRRKRALGAW